MNRRGVGVSFIALAILLFISKNLIAVIFGIQMHSYTKESLKVLISIMDSKFDYFAIILLVAGILYVLWSELEEEKKDEPNS